MCYDRALFELVDVTYFSKNIVKVREVCTRTKAKVNYNFKRRKRIKIKKVQIIIDIYL